MVFDQDHPESSVASDKQTVLASSKTAALEFPQMTKLLKVVDWLLFDGWKNNIQLNENKFESIHFGKGTVFKLFSFLLGKCFVVSNSTRDVRVIVNLN